MQSVATATTALALMIGLMSAPAHSAGNQGVVFVHGALAQTDATRDYWRPVFIDTVRQGLQDSSNYLVISCDIGQYAWKPEAAGCVAEQLTAFIDSHSITTLVVIAHSHGGNVMRWILSNPTYDSRYPKIIDRISKVIALAPSSAGTPLADAVMNGNRFEAALGWLLGFKTDSVVMQQVGHMAVYNAQNLYGTAGRPALPTPFKAMVGSDVETAAWDPDSYCGGYAEALGLEIAQLYLSRCSDGFLDCSSQSAAGTVWFVDKERTKGAEPLNHNQSRRECAGLGTLLRNELAP